MKLPPFECHRPTEVDEAVALLAELGDEAKVLAGGQSLIPLLSFRLAHPTHLIDVNNIDSLQQIVVDGRLELGAMVRHSRAESSREVRDVAPLVADAVRHIGHRAIRNRGTIGGSLSHADPAAELPAVLCTLGGEIVTQSRRGSRTIVADDFFKGFLTTDLAPDELLTAVCFPVLSPGTGWSFLEFSRRSGDFAVVGVAALISLDDGGAVRTASVVLSGVDSVPVHAVEAEEMMIGEQAGEALWAAAAERAASTLAPLSDLHGSSEYRRHLARCFVQQCLTGAHRRCGVGPEAPRMN